MLALYDRSVTDCKTAHTNHLRVEYNLKYRPFQFKKPLLMYDRSLLAAFSYPSVFAS